VKTGDVLLAEGLVKTFGKGQAAVRAVDHVDVTLSRGELVIVMGPSGSGKTTLVSILGALLRPDAGRVAIDGEEIGRLSPPRLADFRARRMGFVFQAFNLVSALTVEENVLLPATLVRGGAVAARKRAAELIERLGLAARRRARPGELSGGEMQRVAIARALVNEPPLILADEPTGNLDSRRGQEVMMVLHDVVRDEGRTALIVTHDPRVEDVADRILWLEDGRLRDRKQEPHDWKVDPVCGMRVDAWTAEVTLGEGPERIVFCSSRCRRRYLESEESRSSDGALP